MDGSRTDQEPDSADRRRQGDTYRATPPLDRPQAVGFLLSQLGYETARRFGLLMGELGLEPRQFALLRAIAGVAGRSQNEVGAQLHIPPSSMVSVVDHLEDRGLLQRRPHPEDRRARLLYVTPTGRQVLERAMALAWGFEEEVCQALSEKERQQLIDLLGRVADTLGLERGLHPDTSSGHGRPHWTEEPDQRLGPLPLA